MNYYAGFLLQCGFSGEESFHILAILFFSKDYLLCYNFHDGFKQTLTATQILSENMDGNVKEKLDDYGIT